MVEVVQAEAFRVLIVEKASFSFKSVLIGHCKLVYSFSLPTIAYIVSKRRIFTAKVYDFVIKLSVITLNLITLNFLNPVAREMKNLFGYALHILFLAPVLCILV